MENNVDYTPNTKRSKRLAAKKNNNKATTKGNSLIQATRHSGLASGH